MKRDAEYYREWRARNPEKSAAISAAYKKRRPFRSREWDRKFGKENNHKRIHGIGLADRDAMVAAQDGCCYLCGDPLDMETPRGLSIDHDHRCCIAGASCAYCRRGIACNACNTLIGLAKDDPERLRRIADNLEAAIADVDERLRQKPQQLSLIDDEEVALWRAPKTATSPSRPRQTCGSLPRPSTP